MIDKKWRKKINFATLYGKKKNIENYFIWFPFLDCGKIYVVIIFSFLIIK
jgi:hypothetical protein